MRIGVVTTSYPRRPGDHAGSFVAAHVDAMRALGHHVDVVTIDSSLFAGHGAPELLERGRGYMRGAWFTARLAARIMERVTDWDLVVAHWLVPALAVLPALAPSSRAAGPTRKPILAIAHGGDVHTLRRLHLLAPVLHLLRARGAKLAFVSDDLRALANAPTALVQAMGIDTARYAAITRAPTTPATVLFVGRLVPIKGADVLVRAAAQLRAQIVIAGDGPERARLERDAPAN